MTEVKIEIEPAAPPALPCVATGIASEKLCRHIAAAIQDALNFRAAVQPVAPGTLPRFEMKARRFVRARH